VLQASFFLRERSAYHMRRTAWDITLGTRAVPTIIQTEFEETLFILQYVSPIVVKYVVNTCSSRRHSTL
jgi:hypothetical protein